MQYALNPAHNRIPRDLNIFLFQTGHHLIHAPLYIRSIVFVFRFHPDVRAC